MSGKFILKFLLYNRNFLCVHTSFFRNLFWFKFYFFSGSLGKDKDYRCLVQRNSKGSFLKKPKLNRFIFLKCQYLGVLPFRKN